MNIFEEEKLSNYGIYCLINSMRIWMEYIPDVTRDMKNVARTSAVTRSWNLNFLMSPEYCYCNSIYEK
jgi:RNA-splicing ligase RtcB